MILRTNLNKISNYNEGTSLLKLTSLSKKSLLQLP